MAMTANHCDTIQEGARLWQRVLAMVVGAGLAGWGLTGEVLGQGVQEPGGQQPGQTQSSTFLQQTLNDPFTNPLLNNGYLPPFFSTGTEFGRLFPNNQLPAVERQIPTSGLPVLPEDLAITGPPGSIQVDGALDLRPIGGLDPLTLVAPAPLTVRRNDWPEVIRLQLGALDPEDPSVDFAPDRAVLVRSAGRVWFTRQGDPPIPKDWRDKVAVMFAGDQVATRTFGRFQLMFQDGAQLRATGLNGLRFDQLDEDQRRVRLTRVDRLQWLGSADGCELVLPDQTRLVLPSAEPGEPSADLFLETKDGLLWVLNRGPKTILVRSAFGEFTLSRGRRIAVLPEDPKGRPGAAPLVAEGALRVARDGRILRATGLAGGGVLRWCGAAIPVSAGATVQLDPLGGDAFPVGPAMVPEPTDRPSDQAAPSSGEPSNSLPGAGGGLR